MRQVHECLLVSVSVVSSVLLQARTRTSAQGGPALQGWTQAAECCRCCCEWTTPSLQMEQATLMTENGQGGQTEQQQQEPNF